MYRQIKFKDFDGVVLGGILDEEHNIIICGCCGGTFELDEVEIIEYYKDWVNISYEIIGE